MKKIIKLKESDLTKIVQRVLNEQMSTFGTAGTGFQNFATSNEININPKNLKLGDGGKNHPNQIDDVKRLQQILINKKYLVLPLNTPLGYFGNLTNKALINYNSRNKTKSNTPSNNNQKTTKIIDFNKLPISEQVKKQLNYMKSNGILTNEKFTILDDKMNVVHCFTPNYTLVKTYNVNTGKDKGDEIDNDTVFSFVKSNWKEALAIARIKFSQGAGFKDVVDFFEDLFYTVKKNKLRNTPSGVFLRMKNPVWDFMKNAIMTTLAEKSNGKRFISFDTLDGQTLAYGFHGTQSTDRLRALDSKNISNRNITYGCINFKEKDILEINEFITPGQVSVWLSDVSNDVVPFPQSFMKK